LDWIGYEHRCGLKHFIREVSRLGKKKKTQIYPRSK
jgi:hypothetical protein